MKAIRPAYALLLCLVLLAAAGCTTALTPARDIGDAQDVYVVDEGRTSSLVIPNDRGGMIQYAYGDWDWYALRKIGLYHGIAALCWPTAGALGRREHSGPPSVANVLSQVNFAEKVYAVPVEREAIVRVRDKLERLYAANIATEVDTPSVNLRFVHYPDAYWWAHDSNHEVATWLSEMDVEVRGPAILASWRVKQQPRR